ncbi:MAG: hypothetical protein ACXWU6_14115 [Allosphingosinicella sp.]
MDSKRENGDGKRRHGKAPLTALAMGLYVKRLSEGANHGQAAEASGFTAKTFRTQRKRDPEFGAMCDEAVARSRSFRFVHGGNKRSLQLVRNRHARFTPERQDAFLKQFAATGNLVEAADKADVSPSTVDYHRRTFPEFERRVQEALDHAYLKLEADLLAARLAAQRRTVEIGRSDDPGPEFDRALKLLQRWDRVRGGNSPNPGRRADARWNFEEAITLLEKKLRNLGIPIEPLPPRHERPDGDLRLPPPPPPGSGSGDGGKAGDEGEGGE